MVYTKVFEEQTASVCMTYRLDDRGNMFPRNVELTLQPRRPTQTYSQPCGNPEYIASEEMIFFYAKCNKTYDPIEVFVNGSLTKHGLFIVSCLWHI